MIINKIVHLSDKTSLPKRDTSSLFTRDEQNDTAHVLARGRDYKLKDSILLTDYIQIIILRLNDYI